MNEIKLPLTKDIQDLQYVASGVISEMAIYSYTTNHDYKQRENDIRRTAVLLFKHLLNATYMQGVDEALAEVPDKKFKNLEDLRYKLNTCITSNVASSVIEDWFCCYTLALSKVGFIRTPQSMQKNTIKTEN